MRSETLSDLAPVFIILKFKDGDQFLKRNLWKAEISALGFQNDLSFTAQVYTCSVLLIFLVYYLNNLRIDNVHLLWVSLQAYSFLYLMI
jgi:hypothetical protein